LTSKSQGNLYFNKKGLNNSINYAKEMKKNLNKNLLLTEKNTCANVTQVFYKTSSGFYKTALG